tara:strand:- start:421 stop:666 length:246 start_codon:yes stop_codon:yes gene_type:complete
MNQKSIDAYLKYVDFHGRNVASVAAALSEHGPMTHEELCNHLHMTGSLIKSSVKTLVEGKDVEVIKSYGDKVEPSVYRLKE